MNTRRLLIPVLAVTIALAVLHGQSQSPPRQDYDLAYIGPPLADPVMQHSKETYVLFGCAYCHGMNLVARGEATDLMHSALVGRDENANLIGPLLRAGIPQTAKLSPMPQFSDLSNAQIVDITRYIHYARQLGRYKELFEAKALGSGNAATGKAYADQHCRSCHQGVTDLSQAAKKYSRPPLTAKMLHPDFLDRPASWKLDQLNDTTTAEARQRHAHLLENYTESDVANLLAWLESLK